MIPQWILIRSALQCIGASLFCRIPRNVALKSTPKNRRNLFSPSKLRHNTSCHNPPFGPSVAQQHYTYPKSLYEAMFLATIEPRKK